MGFFDHRTGWIGELEPVALKQKLSLFVEPLPKKEKTEWLSEVSAVTLQQSLLNLNRASTNFFEGLAEHPSFKSKKAGQTARYVGTAFEIREENGKRKLRLSKMPGLIRIRWPRELPPEPSS
ncbi:transposase [Salinibacter ruber]|uniref:hypothetical protein n=1 Tax=Salinibacter ruber TaxID=146919 RepID=UPI0021696C77|nr:hypothetical protein [Salinibacter ruber]MCS4191786.1 transposase [Salinibacter ruber]